MVIRRGHSVESDWLLVSFSHPPMRIRQNSNPKFRFPSDLSGLTTLQDGSILILLIHNQCRRDIWILKLAFRTQEALHVSKFDVDFLIRQERAFWYSSTREVPQNCAGPLPLCEFVQALSVCWIWLIKYMIFPQLVPSLLVVLDEWPEMLHLTDLPTPVSHLMHCLNVFCFCL